MSWIAVGGEKNKVGHVPISENLSDVQRSGVFAPPGHWRLGWYWAGRRREASILIDRRAFLANVGLGVALILTSLIYLCTGTVAIAPASTLRALFSEAEPTVAFVVNDLRLPRMLAAWLTGAAFAVAGCLMQTLARNRLATPGIIGIDNGATAFAVASVVGLGVSLAPPAMALTGAATATALTFGLAGGGGTRGYRFIVAGIGVGAVFGAATQLLMARVAIDVANAAYPWTVGTLNARPTGTMTVLAIGLGIGVVLSLRLSRALSTMRFSEAIAQGLGISLRRSRLQALSLAVSLTALAVAVAGPVGMVGLIGPEIARHLSSPRGVPVIGSALAGALVMTVSDGVGRLLLSPIELPVGIVTAIVGGPYLLWILLRQGGSGNV
ncbi:FecCD family ABC transporter permease [Aidingimonas lacisalsi]|uniref:FecCD family ABC transporter permease n=1 Tax=Aidingimonas lacisalsi TaxID=2604086 RepID=UPI0011D1ECD5|nr:iron ABC transporter permease [Aidingimonas lacisalsi]